MTSARSSNGSCTLQAACFLAPCACIPAALGSPPRAVGCACEVPAPPPGRCGWVPCCGAFAPDDLSRLCAGAASEEAWFWRLASAPGLSASGAELLSR